MKVLKIQNMSKENLFHVSLLLWYLAHLTQFQNFINDIYIQMSHSTHALNPFNIGQR